MALALVAAVMKAAARAGSTGFQVMPPAFSAVPTIAPSATSRTPATVSVVTPVLASTGTSPAPVLLTAALASLSCARSVGSPVIAPLISRASTPRNAALRARSAIVRWPNVLANSGVMFAKMATPSAPIADR